MEATPLWDSHPELAKEFHWQQNIPGELSYLWIGDPGYSEILMHEISADMDLKVWWYCGKCSHEWKANVRQRARGGSGCPHCSGRVVHSDGRNSMRNTHPDLASEFHPTKNGEYTPDDLKAGTNKKLWWECISCSHVWQAQGKKRAKGSRCPRHRSH